MFDGKFLDGDDLGGDEDGGLTGVVRGGDFDEGLGVILLFTFEAEAAAGHVFADDDFITAIGMADAGGKVHAGADVLAALLAILQALGIPIPDLPSIPIPPIFCPLDG